MESRGALGICGLLIVGGYKNRLGAVSFIYFILEHKQTERENWGHLGYILGMGARQKSLIVNRTPLVPVGKPNVADPSAAMISTPSTLALIVYAHYRVYLAASHPSNNKSNRYGYNVPHTKTLQHRRQSSHKIDSDIRTSKKVPACLA